MILASRALAMLATAILVFWNCCALADYAAGLAAFEAGDFSEAFHQWQPEASAGNAKAQHGLGILYETGRGVPSVNAKKAAELYQMAADQNYAPSMSNLARLYEDGRGIPQDQARALDLWRRAADLGNSTALYNLGTHFADGIAVAQDPTEAAKYFHKAADLGLPEAIYAMAQITRDGLGVPVDEAASQEWLRKAAAAGHARAKMDLAAIAHEAQATSQVQSGEEQSASGPAPDAVSEHGNAEAADTASTSEPDVLDSQAENAAPSPDPGGAENVTAAIGAASGEGSPNESSEGNGAALPGDGGIEAEDTQSADASDSGALAEPEPTEPLQSSAEGGESRTPQGTEIEGVRYLEVEKQRARVYRIWLGQSGQEKDAKSQWAKFQQQFPAAVGKLELDLRRYYLGEAKGSIYRIFAGPFDDQEIATTTCRSIADLDKDQFCRVVVN